MRSYRRLRWFAVCLLVVLFAVGMASEIPPRREVFPFASWFLFVLVPHHVRAYDLELRAADGQPLKPPLRFSRGSGWVAMPHSVTAAETIQALGQALERGEKARVNALRRQIDAYCGPARLQYDVVAVTYDPAARYETGATLERRVLGTFIAREP